MKNTTFRRRALVSSVAMLLVAMLALGSATFAWFSVRPDASATGLVAATTKASSLQIKELKDDNWASEITFDSNNYSPGNLNPVTFDGTNWKTASAEAYDSSFAKQASDLSTVTLPSANSSYAAWSTVYVKYGEYVNDTTKEKDLTLTIAAPSNSGGNDANALSFVRVAVVPAAAIVSGDNALALGSSAVIFGQTLDGDFSADPTAWIHGASASNASATTSAATNVFGNNGTANLGNMINGRIYGFYVYAYYEGTDPDCKDSTAGQTLNNFVFTFNTADHT